VKPDQRFLKQPKNFWANVRSLSQKLGYTVRGTGQIKVFTIQDIIAGLKQLSLSTAHVANTKGEPTEFGKFFTHISNIGPRS
jgi:hypothetical protein